MKYDFQLSITTSVSAETVEKMVKAMVEEQTGRKVKSITPRSRPSTGSTVSTYVFDGYGITFEDEKGSRPKNEDASFTPDVFTRPPY
jgi:hypothetical protein